MALEDFASQMQLNYFGVLSVVHAVYPDMVRRNAGHICLVGSALSSFGAFSPAVNPGFCKLLAASSAAPSGPQRYAAATAVEVAVEGLGYCCGGGKQRGAELSSLRASAALVSRPGIVGYSAYCPSKYAVKGLADVLRNEVRREAFQPHAADLEPARVCLASTQTKPFCSVSLAPGG
jgi:NAD(P)-dependent dehydrogenase (short-subunit alcohol dehydrogenase family)